SDGRRDVAVQGDSRVVEAVGRSRDASASLHALGFIQLPVDGGDRAVESLPLLVEHTTLTCERVGHRRRPPIEQGFDLPEGKADELQRGDLLEAVAIVGRVQAVARTRALWFEQTDAIVVMQRFHRDARELRKLADPICLAHAPSRVGSSSARNASGSNPETISPPTRTTGSRRAPRAINSSMARESSARLRSVNGTPCCSRNAFART